MGYFRFVDIDECQRDFFLCRGGVCLNIEGSYRCECFVGYQLFFNILVCIGKEEVYLFLVSYLIYILLELEVYGWMFVIFVL